MPPIIRRAMGRGVSLLLFVLVSNVLLLILSTRLLLFKLVAATSFIGVVNDDEDFASIRPRERVVVREIGAMILVASTTIQLVSYASVDRWLFVFESSQRRSSQRQSLSFSFVIRYRLSEGWLS